jgi:hypothetical protein
MIEKGRDTYGTVQSLLFATTLDRKTHMKFSRGLWDHQIKDNTTGNFSRHAGYDRHSPGGGNEFPRHGGYYIATWAEAYTRTKDTEYRCSSATARTRTMRSANWPSAAPTDTW